jgi:hypothetical protein
MTEALLTSWLEAWRSALLEHSASMQYHPAIVAPMVDNISRLNGVAEQLYRRCTATLTL